MPAFLLESIYDPLGGLQDGICLGTVVLCAYAVVVKPDFMLKNNWKELTAVSFGDKMRIVYR